MPKLIDLTGRIVDDWTVLGREKTEKSKYHYWRCKCKCGFERLFTSTNIQFHLNGDCGCSTSLTGKRFGRLIALDKIGKKSNTLSSYNCKCDCGRLKVIRGAYLLAGVLKSCGCAMTKTAQEVGPRVAMQSYKRSAIKRKLEFSLTKEKFLELILANCHYCDGTYTSTTKIKFAKNTKQRIFLHNGIDRVDNAKGYTDENSVSCCSICNLMKRELSVGEWKIHMKKVLSKMEKQAQGG